MSDELAVATAGAVAEPESSIPAVAAASPAVAASPSLEDDYVAEAPGEEEVPPAVATASEPSAGDTGEEANAAEEKTPAKETTAEVKEPAFPEDLVAHAKQIGYESPESFGTKENLQHAVDQFNQQIASLGRGTMAAPTSLAPAPQALVQQASPSGPDPAIAPPIPELKEFGEELEPEVREPLNRLVQRHKAVEVQQKGRIDALQQTVDQLQAQGVQQARLAISNQVDGFISTLPKEYAEHLGTGSRSQLGANSAASKTRSEIDQQIEILIAGYGAAGRELPPDGELILAATRNVLGSKNDSIIQKQTAVQVRKRQNQATARPAAQKTSRKQTDAAKATAAVDEAWAKTGLPDGDDEEIF